MLRIIFWRCGNFGVVHAFGGYGCRIEIENIEERWQRPL